MKSILYLTVLLMAGPALARPMPTPPPSGKVVHLFGPNSVSSNFLPGIGFKGLVGTAAPSGGTSGTANASGATQTASDEPSMGQVLHQMFVVGDPNRPPSPLVPGRAAEQPHAVNP